MESDSDGKLSDTQIVRLVGLGIAIGAGAGIVLDNLALGIGVGIILGVVFTAALRQRSTGPKDT